ncbi:unnamed protein product [Rhizophagus irregularis]|nr:unnamed protein product [Rhizophagus irregularis]CAB4461665.1 unnamed protein product [Rhizophagus irregularis]CAB5142069.1 unnamed protein product [Rhizophagus irregularis]
MCNPRKFVVKMTSESSEGKKVTLKSCDDVEFKVEIPVASRSILLKNMIEDVGETDQSIPLPNVNEKVLKKVLEWCQHHVNDPQPTNDDDDSRRRNTEIDDWDQRFLNVEQDMLFEIILAANYLDIKPLLDIGCKTRKSRFERRMNGPKTDKYNELKLFFNYLAAL